MNVLLKDSGKGFHAIDGKPFIVNKDVINDYKI